MFGIPVRCYLSWVAAHPFTPLTSISWPFTTRHKCYSTQKPMAEKSSLVHKHTLQEKKNIYKFLLSKCSKLELLVHA